MPFFIHDNQQLHYETCGVQDPSIVPILLLHGNGEDMTTFGRTVAHLLNTHCFVLMDSRSQGDSFPLAGGMEELHYDDMAEDALALMEFLGIPEYDVVGYSDGGIIALLMASRSMCVRRVVTIGANSSPKGLTLRARHMMERERKRAAAASDLHTAELMRLMLEEPHITLSDLAGIIAEVTVVLGGNDPFIKRLDSMQIADAIPHGSHMLIPGAGHDIPETRPELLADIIRNVL